MHIARHEGQQRGLGRVRRQHGDAVNRLQTRQRMETMSDEELFDVRWVDAPLPGPARLFKTVRCSRCGEGVMEARAHLQDGQPLCPECYGEAYTRRLG